VVGVDARRAVADPVTNTLAAGQSLSPGQELVSPGGGYVAVMQGDGNFVVYAPGFRALFATNTFAAGAGLFMQGDGNLVLYASGRPLFYTYTFAVGAELVLQADGNLVVYAGGRPLWSYRTGLIPPPPPPSLWPASLTTGQSLTAQTANDRLVSPSGMFALSVRADDLVLYQIAPWHYNDPQMMLADAYPSWATVGNGAWPNPPQSSFVLQGDGNLVLYETGGVVAWTSGTWGSGATTLAMQDDGNLVLYTAGGVPVWASSSAQSALPAGQTLRSGGQLVQNFSRRQTLAMQGDGNLVDYICGRAAWASNTFVPGSTVTMQTDGNLVIYTPGGQAAWASNTFGPGREHSILGVTGNGLIVIIQPGGSWAVPSASSVFIC
jgi:hypothetical protein